MRQFRNRTEGNDSIQDLQPVDLSTTDWIAPGQSTNSLWFGAAGNVRVLMHGAQLGGRGAVGAPAKREAEDDSGADGTPAGFKTRAITIPVTAGYNRLSVVRIYKTGTDAGVVAGGIWAGYTI